MDVEKAIFRLILASVLVTAVTMTASSWHEIKRYVRISRM